MPVQHKYKPHHLVLAIALAVGCMETSMAQQPEPQVISDAPTPKSRKKNSKPNERIVDRPAPKELIKPQKKLTGPQTSWMKDRQLRL